MRKLYLLLLASLAGFFASAQLTGTKNIPGDYPTISAAVSALNTSGVGSGGVTFLVAAGHTESSADSVYLLATGTAADPILFQKSGAGANPVVTRTGSGLLATSTLGGSGDAVILIEGSDYVTFDGIDVATAAQGIEYGYFLRKASATDGCKNVTITNANITMTKGTSAYVTGIYISNNFKTQSLSSATGIVVTSTGGRHENITITKNVISNVFTGIIARGYVHASPYDFYDQNLVIGGTAGNGNTIQNFAGNTASTAYGVYLIYQNGGNVSYNTVNNTAGGGAGGTSTIYGIFMSTGNTSSFTATNNTVTMTTSASSSGIYGVYNSGASGAVVLDNNTVSLNTTASTSGTFGYIYNGNTTTSTSIAGNTLVGSSINTTGTTYLIYNSNSSAGAHVIQNNQISGTLNRTGTSGTLYGYYDAASPTGVETISGNVFSNITLAGTSTFYGIYSNTTAVHTQNIFNNTVSNITGGSGAMYMIYTASSLNASVYSNTLHTTTGTGNVYGIYIGSGAGNFYKNKIYGLTSTSATGLVYGFNVQGGTPRIYNNFIGDLKATASSLTAPAPSVAGLYLNSGTISAFYNTVYLSASSTGANFGTAAVYTSTTPSITLRNNIFVNISTASGTGKTIAHQRSGTSIASFSTTSNNNDYYAGTPGVNNLIYFDGTNSAQTLAAYQALVAPAEGSSISELPTFLSTTGGSANFLHIDNTVATLLESGAINIAGITDDFDGDIRQGNPGYAGTGVKPDIGADEFSGIVSSVSDLAIDAFLSPLPIGCDNSATTGVTVRLRNNGTTTLDFATTNATITGTVTGAISTVVSATLTSGTLAPGATMDVTLSPNISSTTAGTYNFSVTAAMAGDVNTANNTWIAVSTVAPNATLPQSVDFTGFTGTNLTTLFPNWSEATGTTVPGGTTSAWTNSSAIGGAGNVSARINLYTSTRNEWIVGPKFSATSNTKLKFDVAITENASGAVDAAGMQGTDDAVIVKISTDCGYTWTDLYTFNAANTASITNSFVAQEINLSAYAGQNVIIAFFASDGPVDNTPDYDFHIDNVNIVQVLPTDVGAIGLANPLATGCYSNAETVKVTIRNYGTSPLDLSLNPVTVTTNVTGAATATLTGTVNTGIIAPNGTLDVTMSSTLNMSAAGVYTFNASTTMAGDAQATNDAMTAATRTVVASQPLPQTVDFTGFTGANLTTVFPNWYEATGATLPTGTTSAWRNTTGNVGGATNVTAALNLYTDTRNEWIVGPKVNVTANTKLKFDVAITNYASSAADPAGMQGTDDRVVVRISTNCGQSWIDLYTFNAGNTTAITNSLVAQEIDLSAYAGQQVIIAFFATDGPVNDTPDYDFHIDNVNVTEVFPTDVGAVALSAPVAISCFSNAETVKVTIKNYGTAVLDFSVNPVTVTTNVTGAATATLTGTISTGTLAPGATTDVTMTGTLNMTATGTYIFNASTSMTADPFAANDAMPAATRTLVAPVTLPQTVDFTGFTGANLSAVFPNWSEGAGATLPSGTTSNWTNKTGVGSATNVTAKVNLYTNTFNEWIVGPKFTATAQSHLNFSVALTDYDGTTADPVAMQGTDDKVIVRVSADCGATWTDVYTFSAANTASISNNLVPQSIPLGSYAGQNIIVAFFATDGTVNDAPDYDFHIDDVNILDLPPCTGAVGGTATAATTTYCGSGSTFITATGYSTGTGSTYQWESSVDNTNWTVIAGQTTPGSVGTGTLSDTTYYRLKVTCPSGTGTAYSNVVTIFVNPIPVVTLSTVNVGICPGGNATITASGTSDTYSWTPSAGLNTTTGPTVIATPALNTLYTVTGTITASGCTKTETVLVRVNPTVSVTATSAQANICAGGSTQLNATATQNSNPVLITEVTVFRTGTGQTATYPSYIGTSENDFVEISNISSAPFDISGYTLTDYANNSATATHNYTFPAGTIIPANGVIVVHLGSGTNNIASGYYNTGGTTDSWNSGSQVGIVLKNGTAVIDAVGTGGSATGSYTFAAGTGVTTADWSGFAPNASGLAGVIRTAPLDNNLGQDWSASSATLVQTIGTYNGGYTAPSASFTYVWSPATGLSSTTIANPVASPTTTQVYTVTATETTTGCSNTATVTVTVDAPTVITTQPTAQAACSGATVNFTVAATGTGTLTYQWKKNGTAITGANSATYTIASVVAGDAGNYEVEVTGTCGTVTSSVVALTLNAATTITTQPTAQVSCQGGTVSFTVAATGTGTLTYQWRKAGVNITGANAATLTLSNVLPADAASYDVIVTGTCGSATSTGAALTVNPKPVAGFTVATTQCVATAYTFTNTSTVSSGTITGQEWDFGDGTTSVLASPSHTYAVAGTYTARLIAISNNGCRDTLTQNILVNSGVSITTQPTAQAACLGGTATFSVTATGAGLAYQWRKAGANITGATGSTLTLNNIVATDAANYDVVITGTCGTATSASVALTINAATSITTQPVAVTACQGNATFSVVAAGSGTLTYQWRFNGTPIPTATTASISIPVIPAANGNYDVVVTGNCGSVTSNSVALTVQNCTSIPNVDATVTDARLLPNIVHNNTVLRVMATRSTKISWTITDVQGRVVLRFDQGVTAGQNDRHLQLMQLAGGMYQLNGQTEKGHTITLRFSKL